jgi:hypothetical protein
MNEERFLQRVLDGTNRALARAAGNANPKAEQRLHEVRGQINERLRELVDQRAASRRSV